MEKDQNRKLVSVNSMEPWKPCERGKWRKTKRTDVLQAQRLKRSGTGRVPQNYIRDNVSWTLKSELWFGGHKVQRVPKKVKEQRLDLATDSAHV